MKHKGQTVGSPNDLGRERDQWAQMTMKGDDTPDGMWRLTHAAAPIIPSFGWTVDSSVNKPTG
ncbi:hypothetical protein Ais01nite_73470 [Asanoa ishikariensis]|nr:hypothetical protein Ais01nite_73470 [Asanoa ishikariensis]